MNAIEEIKTQHDEAALWYWNIPGGCINLSSTFLSLFNYDKSYQSISIKEWEDLFHPEDYKTVQETINLHVTSGGKHPFSCMARCKNSKGDLLLVKCRGEVVEWENEKPVRMIGYHRVLNHPEPRESAEAYDAHLLKLLLDHLPYYIFFKDINSRFTKINKYCAKKFGLNSPEEALGKTDFDIFDRKHAQEAFDDEQAIIQTGKPVLKKIEKEIPSNGQNSVRWVSTSKMPLFDKNNDIIGTFGISRDITAQKKAEQDLREAHNFYNQILSNTSEGIYVVDPDLSYTFWNPKMESMSGMKSKDVLGKKPYDLFPHVYENNLSGHYQRALNGESVRSEDYYYEVKQTGKSGWAQAYYSPLENEDGQIEQVLVTVLDISDRKLAEQKMRKSDETLSKLSEQIPGTIYQYQQYPDGSSRFPFASDSFQKIYELSANEVRDDASKVVERIHKDDLSKTTFSINRSFKTLEDWEIDYRVNLPKKGVRWLRGKARPEKQKDGSVIWHGYIADVTERKKREDELSETLDIVSDQNSRLLNFAHIVSHNLRNHAGNISALLSLYEIEKSDEEKEELFNYLKNSSENLNDTIEDLNEIIDEQHKTKSQVKQINFYQYLAKIKETLSTKIVLNNAEFEESVPADLTLNYNPAYLESILLNLISNAIKYRHPDRNPVIKIDLEETDTEYILTIADNGQGIDLETHGEDFFGMYNTFHDNCDSKGIGLYITKNQIESMGGTIEVDSEVGKGTTFIITIPFIDKESS